MPSAPVATGEIIQAATIQGLVNGSIWFSGDNGAVNAYQVTFNGTTPNFNNITNLNDGLMVTFRALNSNTAAATLQIGALGAKPIVKSGGLSLLANDIRVGQIVSLVYDSVNARFNLLGGQLPASYAASIAKAADTMILPGVFVLQTNFNLLYDTGGLYDSVSGKLKIPAGLSGQYLIIWKATYAANAVGSRYNAIYKAGSFLMAETAALYSTSDFQLSLITAQRLAVGDTVEGACLQTGVASPGLTVTAIGTSLTINYLGA